MCDNCVYEFDHHCSFVNNCIGRRNISYFFGILLWLQIGAVYAVSGALFYVASILIYEVTDHTRLYFGVPIIILSFGVLMHAFQIHWMTTSRIIRCILSGSLLLITACWVIRFPKWYVNPLPLALLVYPVMF